MIRSVAVALMGCCCVNASAQDGSGWKHPYMPGISVALGVGAGLGGGWIMSMFYGDPPEAVPVFAVALGSSVGTTVAFFRFAGSDKLWQSLVVGALGGASAAAVSCGLATLTGETVAHFAGRAERNWARTIKEDDVVSLRTENRVVGVFHERGGVNCYSLPMEFGDSVVILMEDEFTGYPDGADPIIRVFWGAEFPPQSPAIYENISDRPVDKIENPLAYTADSAGSLYVLLESDNPGVTRYTLEMQSAQTDANRVAEGSAMHGLSPDAFETETRWIAPINQARERPYLDSLGEVPLFSGVASIPGAVLGAAAGLILWLTLYR